MAAQLVQELQPVQRQAIRWFDGGNGRGARPVGEQRHFTKCAARSDCADLVLLAVAVGAADGNLAGDDDEKRDASLPFAQNSGASIVVARVCSPLESAKLFGCQALEQLGIGESGRGVS